MAALPRVRLYLHRYYFHTSLVEVTLFLKDIFKQTGIVLAAVSWRGSLFLVFSSYFFFL